MTQRPVVAGTERRGHELRVASERGVPDRVHAAVHAMQLSLCHPSPNLEASG